MLSKEHSLQEEQAVLRLHTLNKSNREVAGTLGVVRSRIECILGHRNIKRFRHPLKITVPDDHRVLSYEKNPLEHSAEWKDSLQEGTYHYPGLP